RMDNANTQLKAEMNQTETIVHSIKDGLVALDKDETILLMNPVAEEIFDVRGEEVKGRNVQVLVDRLVEKVDEPEVFLRKFMAASSSPESESMFNITLARPFRKVLRRMSSAIRDESGAVTGRVVVLSDITREKEVDNMKSNFVSIVSHELRTPLTSIKGALALLLDGQMDDPDTRREFLSIADQNTDRLMSLISGLLDLSRMESGMVRLNVARLDMAGLITSLVRSAELFAGRRGITIETRFSGGKQEVFGDRGQLGQVITNLLDNAVKFSPDGGRVVVRTDAAEDEFTITVEDEGPGIPADKLEKVFERFYQVDMSATRVMGGTGLGLAICRAIISEHAGKIRAESPARPGVGGARIVVKLPKAGIVSRNANPPSVHPVNPASYADSGDDARDTVLLVDKDQEALRVQSMQFGREGYRVITATAGSDALRLARDCRPGFIFMDTDLPDIGGLDVAVMLGKDPDTKDIPIVFTTSAGETGTGQTDGHASGFIVKPYKVNELVATVRQYYM
ncbi:MAG TPA: ATP-binding protein, partial [Nitrospirota bacterium]